MADILPRHVRPKRLKGGQVAYYYDLPTKYRKMKCAVENEPLGTDFAKMQDRAKILNEQFDEWDRVRKGHPAAQGKIMPTFGTVDWLFREYKMSDAYLLKVATRSRPDYEWAMDQVCDTRTKKGERTGDQLVSRLSPARCRQALQEVSEQHRQEERRGAASHGGEDDRPMPQGLARCASLLPERI